MDTKPEPPQIIRPIPRRPFDLKIDNPTPPEEDSKPSTPFTAADAAARLLDPRQQEATSLSRATSLVNLTTSALFGIYSGTAGGDRDREELNTPWGTGALTPVQRVAPGSDGDDADVRTGKGVKVRTLSVGGHAAPHSKTAVLSSLAGRAALLFALGVGYGVLVTRLRASDREEIGLPAQFDGLVPSAGACDWRYLGFWGIAGVALGGLLPWFDGVWEESFGRHDDGTASPAGGRRGADGQDTAPEMDWALVMRGIGAFVGIVFAIRKLPWTSTMQVSLTLALANPFLWYIIDRSKPGFWLSAVVGLLGSAVLMGLDPEMMPTPAGRGGGLSSSDGSLGQNVTDHWRTGSQALGTMTSHEAVETGIWMVSVLFCSCVFFGNIGRRLALNRSSTARGRWGGVR